MSSAIIKGVAVGGLLAAFAIWKMSKGSGYSLFQSSPEDVTPGDGYDGYSLFQSSPETPAESDTVKPLDFIKKLEGLSLKAYKDIAGIVTIGYGHVVRAGEGLSVISEATADELLQADAASAERAVSARVKVPLSDNQRAALVSLVFNIGEGNFAGSTLLRALNNGDYQTAADQIRVWNKAKNPKTGKLETSQGLVNRQEQTRTLFLS